MNFKNVTAATQLPNKSKQGGIKKSAPLVNSLEYELIASLVLQQYKSNNKILFAKLLAIPHNERIPVLAQEYGNKRMHQLLVMIIKAFIMALPLPKTKKLTDTKVSVCACDILLAAEEDQLSIEDIILFFESAKNGAYGKITSLLHHHQVMNMLLKYRQERHDAYMELKEEKEKVFKMTGPTEKTCNEPRQIGEILKQATIFDMTTRMSG